MTLILTVIFYSLLAYLLGSIPSSVWVGMAYHGVDVREHGSGNAGATNTFRVLGKETGIVVLLMDVIKGITATSLVHFIGSVHPGTEQFINLKLLFGLIAVLGHIFPLYVQFRGGKGIATIFGMLIALHWLLALSLLLLFLLVLFLTKYVSLSSLLAAISFPLMVIFVFHRDEPLFIAFGVAAALMVTLTHQKNIVRLLNGEESKAKIFKKR